MARDPEAIPTGRARRATRATAALAPSTVRFASSLATSVVRSPDREWFMTDREIRIDPDYVATLVGRAVEASPDTIRAARAFKLPPDEIFFRRTAIASFAVLGHLRACANWHRMAREYIYGEEPRGVLGRAEAEFFGPLVRPPAAR